ncbi:MAG: hypothetical protein SVG88_06395 [Halobacteriales archaeon]|nr:hypothetical protein [Halobacteriales archaeon]
MNRVLVGGIVLTGLGLGGYGAGLVITYPFRAFSVTAVMVGITLIAIGRASGYRARTEVGTE